MDLRDERQRILGVILREQARERGDSPFLLAGDERLSFAAANARVNAIARGLAELGIGRGDRVLILMHGCVEFVLLALAANKLGAVWVPVNTDYRGAWLAETIADSKGSALAVDAALLPRLLEVRAGVGFGHLLLHGDAADARAAGAAATLAELMAAPAEEPDQGALRFGDTMAILWTSGTTGKSKGVMQSHNVWIRAAEHSNRQFGTHAGDVLYNCMPLYNSAAWVAHIYRALVGGIPCALDAQFSVHAFWDRIRHYGATQTLTLGAMHMFLWNQPPRADDADNPLRAANMVPMPERLVRPFCERFGLEAIFQGFGQSEAMMILSRADTRDKTWKPNALGAVSQGIAMRLLDESGHEVAPGQAGEICVRPEEPFVIFNGYFDNPEATAAAWQDGWYHTGDLGLRDADGDVFFVDRKKDVIRYKGRNVSSVQVEGVALQHPAVQAAAVYGVTSEELDAEQEIKLDVVVRPGAALEPAALARFINDNAPYFCVPRYIEVVDALPLTPTNKVQKYLLRGRPLSAAAWDRARSDFALRR